MVWYLFLILEACRNRDFYYQSKEQEINRYGVFYHDTYDICRGVSPCLLCACDLCARWKAKEILDIVGNALAIKDFTRVK